MKIDNIILLVGGAALLYWMLSKQPVAQWTEEPTPVPDVIYDAEGNAIADYTSGLP